MDDFIGLMPILLSLISALLGILCALISASTLKRKSKAQDQFKLNIINLYNDNSAIEISETLNNAAIKLDQDDVRKILKLITEIEELKSNRKDAYTNMKEIECELLSIKKDNDTILKVALAYETLNKKYKDELGNVFKYDNTIGLSRFISKSLLSAASLIVDKLGQVKA
ncbi:hypothetical protein EFJ49_21610 [Escherichia coli]|uniref:hypothetical protein n=1 Tax=Escherichia coli TaxID=562 RepID=UPI001F49354A|nr:hypothetical protein [Escherichia coli]MCH7127890.1 hypothetical protein [Escherichia coli]